jgi:hypothetical protein
MYRLPLLFSLFFLQKEAFVKPGDGSAAKNVTLAFDAFSRQQRPPCGTLDRSIYPHVCLLLQKLLPHTITIHITSELAEEQ